MANNNKNNSAKNPQKGKKSAQSSAGSFRRLAENKKARFDYIFEETFEAGLVLMGSEVKALRLGLANLKDSYIVLMGGEAYLQKAHISPYAPSHSSNHEPERPRKLLLHREEIEQLGRALQEKGYACVPTQIYVKNGRIKLEIALAKGRKTHDKRDLIRDRDVERDLQRARRR